MKLPHWALTFFATAILTRPGENLLENLMHEHDSRNIGNRELSKDEMALINLIKEMGDKIGDTIKEMKGDGRFEQRWVSIGETHLQQGIMALTRSIAKPTNF